MPNPFSKAAHRAANPSEPEKVPGHILAIQEIHSKVQSLHVLLVDAEVGKTETSDEWEKRLQTQITTYLNAVDIIQKHCIK